MLLVRGSAAFLKRLRLGPPSDPLPADTTALGDWHAHVLTIERRPCALFVNSSSLLTVIVDVAPRSDVMDRFRAHLRRLLVDIGVSGADVQREIEATKAVTIAKSRDRSVIGTINRMKLEIPYYCEGAWERSGRPASQDDLENRFVDEIWRITDYRSPAEIVRERFGLAPVARAKSWRRVTPP